jgi:hypothetical protein
MHQDLARGLAVRSRPWHVRLDAPAPPTNAIERLHEEFRRRIKTQTVLPDAETATMLFWALLASGQIVMRKMDGWETLSQPIHPESLDIAA